METFETILNAAAYKYRAYAYGKKGNRVVEQV
jgi:hypothetical protein